MIELRKLVSLWRYFTMSIAFFSKVNTLANLFSPGIHASANIDQSYAVNGFVSSMKVRMYSKFEKYLAEYRIILAIAVIILDPCTKFNLLLY